MTEESGNRAHPCSERGWEAEIQGIDELGPIHNPMILKGKRLKPCCSSSSSLIPPVRFLPWAKRLNKRAPNRAIPGEKYFGSRIHFFSRDSLPSAAFSSTRSILFKRIISAQDLPVEEGAQHLPGLEEARTTMVTML
jgi:hypothetical protein